jgi:hypothetical protein
MVRVRFLTNLEAAQMASLPDLAAFSQLMMKVLTAEAEGQEENKSDQDALMKERLEYLERAAHLAVLPVGSGGVIDCDCDLAPHQPVLWSREQIRYLDQADLASIVQVAERTEALDRVRPLLQAMMDDDLREPASSGG